MKHYTNNYGGGGGGGGFTINDIHIIDDVFAVMKLVQKRHPTIPQCVTTASYRHRTFNAISSASA